MILDKKLRVGQIPTLNPLSIMTMIKKE